MKRDARTHGDAEDLLPAAGGEAVVTLRLGDVVFGVPITTVRQVLRPPPVTRVPFPPHGVCGVATLRGEVLPVMDLGVLLRGDPAVRPGRLVVVETGAGRAALLVDAVAGLRSGEDLSAPPAETEAALPPGVVRAVITGGVEEPVTVIDIERLLADGPDPTHSLEERR